MSAMLTYIDVASNVDYFQGTGKTRYHSPGGMATLRYYLTKSFVNLYAEAGTEISNFKTRSGDGVEESHTEAMPMLELSASFNLGKSNLTTFLAYRMGDLRLENSLPWFSDATNGYMRQEIPTLKMRKG